MNDDVDELKEALAVAAQVDPMEVRNHRVDPHDGMHIFENSLGQAVHVPKARADAELKKLRVAASAKSKP